MEGWRNPARYVAPLALAAAVIVTYLIVHHALGNKTSSSSTAIVLTTTTARRHGSSGSGPSKAKFYVVKPGDSLSAIAAKTGVPMSTILSLNPHLNPNTLQPSQRLRLRQ